MAKKNTEKSLKDTIIEASLRLAAAESWSNISFEQIILAAQLDRLEVQEYFDDKTDILVAYGRRIDARLFKELSLDEGMSERERVFDILMERFDILNEDREAVLSILGSIKYDPKEAILTFPHLAKSMTRVLEAAGIDTEGLKGAAQVAGLVGVYLYVVRTWKEDESSDMAKTMAALDKALDYAESTANSLLNGNVLSGIGGICSKFKGDEN
ncbi:MAG: TetR family transcriptional regulator [Alphaproteobacteria bacterium]